MVQWEDYLPKVLSTKSAEVVQEACQVLEKHGFCLLYVCRIGLCARDCGKFMMGNRKAKKL